MRRLSQLPLPLRVVAELEYGDYNAGLWVDNETCGQWRQGLWTVDVDPETGIAVTAHASIPITEVAELMVDERNERKG